MSILGEFSYRQETGPGCLSSQGRFPTFSLGEKVAEVRGRMRSFVNPSFDLQV